MSSDTRNGIDILSRFQGTFFGLAVGDALGFPYKSRKRSFLKTVTRLSASGHTGEESGFFPLGQFTDDTQTALAGLTALTESRAIDGAVIAEHLIPLWRDQRAIDPSAAANGVLNELVRGRTVHTTSGLPSGHLEAFGLAMVVPVGIWHCHDTDALVRDAEVVSSITHRDVRVTAAAAGLAAAVAYGVDTGEIFLGALLDRVADAAGRHDGEVAEHVLDFPRILSMTEYRALEKIEIYVSGQTDEVYDAFDRGIPDNALFVLLASLYYFLRSPFDYERAVTSALHAGGEVTTVCALTGALCGAFLGVSAIPDVFIEGLVEEERLDAAVREFHAAWEASQDAH